MRRGYMKIDKLKNVVVLDFDAGSVKMVVGHVVKDEIVVKKMVESHIPEQVYLDGKIINQSVLEDIIKNLIFNYLGTFDFNKEALSN